MALDVDVVRTFLLVTEFGSLTKAADYLDTTQGVVSVKVKRLEEPPGFRLLGRNPRSVGLSREGAPSSMRRENSSRSTIVRYAGRLVRPPDFRRHRASSRRLEIAGAIVDASLVWPGIDDRGTSEWFSTAMAAR
ncbi:hypothetical protein DM992_25080 [Burkholderia sp. JP2-270]|nr:hypothetical protein DM992_25080 [Burkholderia sp. JP2-270]